MSMLILRSLSRRIGFILIATGISIALIFLALQNPGYYPFSGYTGTEAGTLLPRSFVAICCDFVPYTTPQQQFTLSATVANQSMILYILMSNSTELNSWLNVTYGQNISTSEAQSVTALNAYLSSYSRLVVANFTAQPNKENGFNYFPSYVGPILIVFANPNGAALNYTSNWNIQGIRVPSSTGVDVIVVFLTGGIAVSVLPLLTERRRKILALLRRNHQ